jgi:transposase
MWTHENRPKYNRDHLRYPSDLTDDEWAVVELFIPPAPFWREPSHPPRDRFCRNLMLGNPPLPYG